jgi:hypothetical protein
MTRGRLLAAAAAACLALALSGCGGGGSDEPNSKGQPKTSAPATLTDVDSVDDLRTAFNRDEGRPRLLLLLSPT